MITFAQKFYISPMPDKLMQWLEGLGLGQYAGRFIDQEIVYEDLVELDDEDLKELGIPLGPRKRLLKAVGSLAEARSTSTAVPPASLKVDEHLAAWERHPGERKPVTILFADISGSTALTEKLDAEQTHELLYGATQRMCEAIANNSGTLCHLLGDGVMALFGAPIASEYHAVDACEAALEMQQAVGNHVREIEEREGSRLQIRVGLHSGEVVVLTVGEGDAVGYDASGPAVSLAARMEQAAGPGEVYLTAATQRLAASRVETEALEPLSVKGISDPLGVFKLHRVRSAEETRIYGVRTRFVGRRGELKQFKGISETCMEEGQGHTVFIRGEPGIGKTRLVEKFAEAAELKNFVRHQGLVLPFGVGKGRDAIRSLVRSLLGIQFGSDPATRREAADAALNDGRVAPDQSVHLNDFLDLPQPTPLRALYDAMDNATRNAGKQAMLSTLVKGLSAARPLMMIVEDVHWADALTLAHLANLAKAVGECPALLVMTSRIEGDPLDREWRSHFQGSPFVTIDLGPLRNKESLTLIEEFMDASDPVSQKCLERAAGNPLFLEQLLRNAREGAVTHLPDSIQSLVLARIDRLAAEDKRALQAASVIGQRFELDLLRHLLENNDYHCDALVAHDLVRTEGEVYLFAHALIQEGVYSSLIKSRLQALHGKCAAWFSDNDAALHAEHLDHARDTRAARAYLEAAREHAREYRTARALHLVTRGLAVATEQTDRHRLTCLRGELLHDLGDIESSMDANRKALQNASNDLQRCDAWMGLAAGMRVSTDYDAALVLLDQAEPVAKRHKLTRQLSRLHHLRGNLCFPLGRVDDCEKEHRLALAYAREAGSVEDEARALGGLGDAEYVRCRMRSAYDSLRLCVERCREHGLGYAEVANRVQMVHASYYFSDMRSTLDGYLQAFEAATKVGHQRAAMNACVGLCNVYLTLGENDQVAAQTETGRTLSQRLGARVWDMFWPMYEALALWHLGRRDRAAQLLEQAVATRSDTGGTFTGAWALGALSMVADSPDTRERALREGEKILQGNCTGATYLWFYRYAMEGSLQAGDWDAVNRCAQALEDFTRAEPLSWSEFFIARGRSLAALGLGLRDDAVIEKLQRLRIEAESTGYYIAIPAIQQALASI